MCTLTHFVPSTDLRIKPTDILHVAALQVSSAMEPGMAAPRFRVVPAGTAFFHIKESSTGRVRGFREDHNEACALARSLEMRIELLSGDRLR
ncbi:MULTISPECIES: hypothetical protein [unclassified Pseudomonas]|uniref:hypothetical protein n=1 Tax=unclassified Pseudomonas TaxID=196821 RepID=UPI0038023EA5